MKRAAAPPEILGDIAIAPETARRYAKKNGRSLQNEIRVLMLHGILHLMGYDHESDTGQMNRIERKLRRRLGIA
jgi:probable rRNA maturation factor